MKKNNWLQYFLYAVILICYIAFSNKILILLNNKTQMTYNPFLFLLGSTLIFIVLGLLLGLERFIVETRKEGKWRINLPKIIFLGIPSLYFSIGTFIYYYCPIVFVQVTLCYPLRFFFQGNFISVFQIVLGYTISTSFIRIEN